MNKKLIEDLLNSFNEPEGEGETSNEENQEQSAEQFTIESLGVPDHDNLEGQYGNQDMDQYPDQMGITSNGEYSCDTPDGMKKDMQEMLGIKQRKPMRSTRSY
jgi:hypothetical protein